MMAYRAYPSATSSAQSPTVWVVDADVASSAHANGLRYVPLAHGASNYVEAMFVAGKSGAASVRVVYVMSSASASNLRLRVDWVVLGTGDDPTTAKTTGTAFTVTTPNDMLIHEITGAQSADLNVAVSTGDMVAVRLTRLGSDGADTHTGDMRAVLRVS